VRWVKEGVGLAAVRYSNALEVCPSSTGSNCTWVESLDGLADELAVLLREGYDWIGAPSIEIGARWLMADGVRDIGSVLPKG